MEKYLNYIRLLESAAGSVIAVVGWAIVGLVAAWLSGIWFAMLLKEKTAGDSPNQLSNNWQWLHATSIAVGMASFLCVWTVSLYLPIGLSIGTLLLLFPIAYGMFLLWRHDLQINWSGHGTFILVGVITLFIGVWQYVATGLPIDEDTKVLLFSDLHLDLPIHVNKAALITETGLPQINMRASNTDAYGGLGHIGHSVLIAGFANLLGVSLYTAASVNWIIATMLIGFGVLALLSRQPDLKPLLKLIVVLATLVWGQFSLSSLFDPTYTKSPLVTEIWVASRSYWNISQILSIALTLGGLVVLDHYRELRRRDTVQMLALGGAVGMIALGGLVKPSLVIFFGPALLIWLVLSHARLKEYLLTLIVLQAGVFVYFLPKIMHELPSTPSWSLASDQEQWLGVVSFLWHACLSLAIVLLLVYSRSVINGWNDRRWQVIDLCVIAFGGSVLFALLFRENQFVGFVVLQPNIWWGLSACIVLLVPLISREVTGLLQRGGWMQWLTMISLTIALVQIINGWYVAQEYPVMNQRKHDVILTNTLEAARQLSESDTRFALDPSLEHLDLRPYLARPSLMRTSFGSSDDKRAYANWKRFFKSNRVKPPLDRLDAVVLHRNRERLNLYFDKQGWHSTPLNELYTLWRKSQAGISQ